MAKRTVVPQGAVVLGPSGDIDSFSTMDLVVGLHGICQALDTSVEIDADKDVIHRLSIAANVMSSMVMSRIEA